MDSQPKKEKKNYSTSVYLTREEKNELDQIAKTVKLSRHALLQLAIKDFIQRYRRDEIQIAEKTVKVTILKAK